MGISKLDQERIDAFFAAIDLTRAAYQYSTFSYLAFRLPTGFEVVVGRLFFNVKESEIPFTHFVSENVRAGHYRLGEISEDEKALVGKLTAGSLDTPHGTLKFSPPNGGQLGVSYIPAHKEGSVGQSRLSVVTLLGQRLDLPPRDSELDWECRAANPPFDGVRDLTLEYRLGNPSDTATVEAIAYSIAMIDGASVVTGASAKPAILLAPDLNEAEATLGYRVVQQNRVIRRGMMPGSKLTWSRLEGLKRGEALIEIPEGAVVHCIANYRSVAYNHYWITDPNTSQNPCRAVIQTFDQGLTALKEACINPQRGSRDFESALTSLMWMLGLGTAHLGRISDAPDIVAVTPRGNFVLVECTTGVPKTDNKLSKLAARTEVVRRSLKASGFEHRRVLPILVTSLERAAIAGDVEEAKRQQILVMAKEDLDEAVNSTVLLPDPEALFIRGEDTIRSYASPGFRPQLKG